jgi:predicted N-acetyltransferase YhbS
MGFSIRPYQPAHDADAAYALWQAALGAVWPLTRVYFDFITQQPAYRPGDHFVAEADGQVRGFLATHFNPLKPLGSILTLYVHPASCRQGIGTALLRAGLDHLRAAGAQRVQLGGSTRHYFWPGVPVKLPGAVDFFRAAGWTFTEPVHDLTGDLRAYQTPVAVHDRATALGITFRVATPADREAILAFEEREFPHWAQSGGGCPAARRGQP